MTDIVQSNRLDAEDRVDRICIFIHDIRRWQQDVLTAFRERDWLTLGYPSWAAYVQGEFGNTAAQLGPEQKNMVMAAMAAGNMSTRAIAAVAGVSQSTAARAIAAAPHVSHGDSPDVDLSPVDATVIPNLTVHPPIPAARKVTGMDGKVYTPPAPRKQNRPALPPQFQSAMCDLSKLVRKVEKLRADDRYKANRQAIADLCVPEIRRALNVFDDVLGDLSDPAEDEPGAA